MLAAHFELLSKSLRVQLERFIDVLYNFPEFQRDFSSSHISVRGRFPSASQHASQRAKRMRTRQRDLVWWSFYEASPNPFHFPLYSTCQKQNPTSQRLPWRACEVYRDWSTRTQHLIAPLSKVQDVNGSRIFQVLVDWTWKTKLVWSVLETCLKHVQRSCFIESFQRCRIAVVFLRTQSVEVAVHQLGHDLSNRTRCHDIHKVQHGAINQMCKSYIYFPHFSVQLCVCVCLSIEALRLWGFASVYVMHFPSSPEFVSQFVFVLSSFQSIRI